MSTPRTDALIASFPNPCSNRLQLKGMTKLAKELEEELSKPKPVEHKPKPEAPYRRAPIEVRATEILRNSPLSGSSATVKPEFRYGGSYLSETPPKNR